MVKSLIALVLLCASLSVGATASASSTTDDEVNPGASSAQSVNSAIEWNRTLLAIVRTAGAQPPTIHSTRNFAILHAAVYDAVNNIDGTFSPYFVRIPNVSGHASTPAAADQAAHDALVALYPAFQATLDAELQQDLAQIPDGQNKADGIAVGQTVAAQILSLRSNDGSGVTPSPFTPGNQPGGYQLTPPNFAAADFTQWPQVTPFALARADEFRPGPPPELTSDSYTRVFDEVKSLGFINSTTRTPEQTLIGTFWNGNIQDFWNEIAQTAALAHHLDLEQSAHLFALLNISLADTTIAFFDTKYTYDLWRPVTAIQMADTDNNPDTAQDAAWIPLPTKTAPDPSYPGAHSAISAAGAEILRLVLGDPITLDVTSEALAGVTRHFTTFSAAGEEAGLSRIYAGQHFRFDHLAGERLGQQVARAVLSSVSLPRRDHGFD